jgi:hypothetical protein
MTAAPVDDKTWPQISLRMLSMRTLMAAIEEFGSIGELHSSKNQLDRITTAVQDRKVCIIRGVLEPDFIRALTAYLSQIGRNSLPSRHPTLPGCPNHHRVYQWDELSYVKGCFHQFSFFPWNEDIFDLFKKFAPIYRLRNILSGVAPDRYVGTAPDDGCIARISFQFYPSAMGAMNKHMDPVDVHQKAVPILIMSKRGEDFERGGLFYEAGDGARIFADEVANPGDVVVTLAQLPHGVEKIDPHIAPDWLSFRGRWSAVVAVNKMVTNTKIADAVDMEAPRPPHSSTAYDKAEAYGNR